MDTPLPLKSRKKPDACDAYKCRTRVDIQRVKYHGITVKLCHRCRDLWNLAIRENDTEQEATGFKPDTPENDETVHESPSTVHDGPEQLSLPLDNPSTALVSMRGGAFFIDGEIAKAPDGPIAATMRAATRENAITLSYARERIIDALDPIRDDLESSFVRLQGFVVKSQKALDAACELMVDTKGKLKRIEAMRTKLTRPILDLKNEVDSWFGPTKKPGLGLEKLLRDAIDAYREGEKQRKLAALHAGDHEAALAIDAPQLSAGVKDRTLWKWRVTDKTKIPAQYWVLDAAAIQARVTAMKAQCDIPGIEVYPESNIASPAR